MIDRSPHHRVWDAVSGAWIYVESIVGAAAPFIVSQPWR
jgi:hypothetical protein